MKAVRGQILQADVGLNEPKLFVVVSNNRRNRALPSVLTVRLTTTTPRTQKPTMIEVPHGEPVTGWVNCDDVGPVYEGEVIGHRGALSPRTMDEINAGLVAALALD